MTSLSFSSRNVLLILIASASPATALTIDNGLAPPNPANVINTFILESVFVRDAVSGPTTVELTAGGQVGDGTSGKRFEVFDSSTVLMSGGYVGDDIFGHDSATVLMTGGVVNSGVLGFGSSTVIVSGGTIESGLYIDDLATGLVTGGWIAGISGNDDGVVTVTGGTGFGWFISQTNLTIRLVGSDFSVNGVPVGFGEVPASFGATGTITGVLQSGETVDATFSRESEGTIMLVPEAATGALLGGGLLAIGAVGRRNRRSAQLAERDALY